MLFKRTFVFVSVLLATFSICVQGALTELDIPSGDHLLMLRNDGAPKCYNDFATDQNNAVSQLINTRLSCKDAEMSKKKQLDNEAFKEKYEAAKSVNSIAVAFEDKCRDPYSSNTPEDVLASLQCYKEESLKAVKIIFDMSNRANDKSMQISKSIQLAEFDQRQCKALADREYVRTSAKNYRNTLDCDNVLTEEPTDGPTTTLIPTTKIASTDGPTNPTLIPTTKIVVESESVPRPAQKQ